MPPRPRPRRSFLLTKAISRQPLGRLRPGLWRASGVSARISLFVWLEVREGREIPGSATVLGSKVKFGIFEEMVGEEDELSHEGSESKFLGFAGGEEAEVERSKNGVMA